MHFIYKGVFSVSALLDIIKDPDAYFWFLYVLWAISLISLIVRSMCQTINLNECFMLSFISLILVGLMVVFDIRVFGFQFISYDFIFYTLGYFVHKYNVEAQLTKSTTILLLVTWFVLAFNWRMHELPPIIPTTIIPNTIVLYAYRTITAIIAIMVMFKISPIFLNKDTYVNKLLAKVGKISLGLYVCHVSLIWHHLVLVDLIREDMGIVWGIIIVFFVTTISSLAIIALMRRSNLISRFFLGI